MADGSRPSLLRRPVAALSSRLLPPLPATIGEIERRAADSGRPAVDPAVGRYLEGAAAGATRGAVLQLGAARPAASHWLARGAGRAPLVVVEADAAALAAAREGIEGAGLAASFTWIVGEPRVEAERLERIFELVVIDRPAGEARRLFDLVLPWVAIGGTILALGALGDQVAGAGGEGGALAPDEGAALERLRPYVLIHPQLAASLLPLGDGLLVGVKRRPTIRELGGPY